MFLHANVVRVKEGKNNKTFSDKRKPFKWQGEKRRFGEAFIKGKKCTSARRTQHTFHIHTGCSITNCDKVKQYFIKF